MSEWTLYFKEDARAAMVKSILLHPHLEEVISQRLQSLLDFPPQRWFQVYFHEGSATFFPEPGQKVRFSGLADLEAGTIEITRFSIHE